MYARRQFEHWWLVEQAELDLDVKLRRLLHKTSLGRLFAKIYTVREFGAIVLGLGHILCVRHWSSMKVAGESSRASGET